MNRLHRLKPFIPAATESPLGALQPRGESHLLTAPLGQLMRLRHNPFFSYVERRVVDEIDNAMRSR